MAVSVGLRARPGNSDEISVKSLEKAFQQQILCRRMRQTYVNALVSRPCKEAVRGESSLLSAASSGGTCLPIKMPRSKVAVFNRDEASQEFVSKNLYREQVTAGHEGFEEVPTWTSSKSHHGYFPKSQTSASSMLMSGLSCCRVRCRIMQTATQTCQSKTREL